MTLKSYLIIMSTLTAVCWGLWSLVLVKVDPDLTNWLGFTLFYASLFLTLAGSAALIGFLVRFILIKQELAFRLVKEAWRQSFLFAFLLVACLYFLANGYFNWLNLSLLVIGLSVLEFFLLGYSKP